MAIGDELPIRVLVTSFSPEWARNVPPGSLPRLLACRIELVIVRARLSFVGDSLYASVPGAVVEILSLAREKDDLVLFRRTSGGKTPEYAPTE